MSFSQFLRMAFYLFLGLSFVGCSQYLNGKKQESQVIELSSDRFACLKKLPDNLKSLSVGEIANSEIDSSFNCVEDALTYFNERTKGSVDQGYTIEDMRQFFGKYFFTQNNVSPEFGGHLMVLKKALFGGSPQVLTKSEIQRIIDFLKILKGEVTAVAPHLKLLLLKPANDKVEWNQVTTATDQLRKSLQVLVKNTDFAVSDFSFSECKSLLWGLSDFINGGTPFVPYQSLGTWVPLIESIKNVLFSEKAHFVGAADWSYAADNVVDMYTVFLRYQYVITKQDLNTPASLRNLAQFAQSVFALINSSYQMNRTGEIPFKYIDNLVEQLALKMTLPFGLTPPSIEESYRVMILKVLEPTRHGESRGLYALTRQHLVGIKREYNVWRLSQSFVDYLSYNKQGLITREALLERYENYDFKQLIRKGLETDALEQQALEKSWADFGILLKSDNPVSFDEQGRFYVLYDQKHVMQSWKALTKFNLMKSLTRILMIAYGDKNSLEMANSALGVNDLIQWYDDFKTLGLEIKAFDPRNLNSGKRSFMEANFFTFSGNGDDRMDFKESFEFISNLFSAGLGTGGALRDGLKQAGCELAQVDVFGYKVVAEPCFKAYLRKNFSSHFANLYSMALHVNKLTDAQWEEYYNMLITSTRVSDPKNGYIETADIRTMVVVLHYIETIFTLYDKDANQGLSLKEVYTAAPRFTTFLRTLSPGTSDGLLADGFACLVESGKKPAASDVLKFKVASAFVTYSDVNRTQIVKVFSELKKAMEDSGGTTKPSKVVTDPALERAMHVR